MTYALLLVSEFVWTCDICQCSLNRAGKAHSELINNMSSMKDSLGDGLAEQGLLAGSKESFDSDKDRLIIIKSSRRYGVLYTSICILVGMAFSLTILSVTSSIKLAGLQPVFISPEELGLDPPLAKGQDPVENGYWCGTTPAEARSRGCQFDIVLYSWVPAPCYDGPIQQQYLDENTQTWWLHRGAEGGQKVSQDLVALGEQPALWLSWAYHDYHCQFIWKMMTRILRNSSMGVPGRLLEYYHTDHCINVLKGTEATPPVDVSTKVSLNYSTCYSRTEHGF